MNTCYKNPPIKTEYNLIGRDTNQSSNITILRVEKPERKSIEFLKFEKKKKNKNSWLIFFFPHNSYLHLSDCTLTQAILLPKNQL